MTFIVTHFWQLFSHIFGQTVLASLGISNEVEIEFKISKGIRSAERHAQKACIADVVIFVVCFMHLLHVEVLLFISGHEDTCPGRNYLSRMTIMSETSLVEAVLGQKTSEPVSDFSP